MKPLTAEQRRIAEENHDLVYQFLNENHLPESQYYDVVIFGYLCAAQDYCESSELQKYSFATMAWRRMKHEVYHYHKHYDGKENNVFTVNFSDISERDVYTQYFETLPEELETKLLLHSLAKALPNKQMRIIRMKLDGCRMHEIAKEEHMTFQNINRMLDEVYDTVIQVMNY